MVVATNPDAAIEISFRNVEDNHYECRVWIVPETVGGYSAHVVTLPGASSQGDTPEEALENLKEAFRGVVETYGQSIPWSQDIPDDKPSGTKELWVVVDV